MLNLSRKYCFVIARTLFTTGEKQLGPVGQRIHKKLTDAFQPLSCSVVCESDKHRGAQGQERHFAVFVASDQFDDTGLVQRHRLVHKVLSDEIAAGVHALRIEALSSREFERRAENDGMTPVRHSYYEKNRNCRTMAVRAAGLIIYRQVGVVSEYLMMQTSYGKFHWTPPKGHVDPDETERVAAVRETLEEAGLRSDDYTIDENFSRTLHYQVVDRGTNKLTPKTVIYWLAKVNDNNVEIKLSVEHKTYRWCKLASAIELIPDYMDMKQMLREADLYLISINAKQS